VQVPGREFERRSELLSSWRSCCGTLHYLLVDELRILNLNYGGE